MKRKSRPFLKVLIIVGIILVMLLPAQLILHGVIWEREELRDSAVSEVSESWAGTQRLTGPFITIPYTVELLSADDDKVVEETRYLHIMPENMKVQGNVQTQELHRNIYDVTVYNSDIKITGNFGNVNYHGIPMEELQFDKAMVTMGISDLHGLEERVVLNLGDLKCNMESGVQYPISSHGLHADVQLTDSLLENLPFSVHLSLKGAKSMDFCPVAGATEISVKSDWPDPSFKGNYIPSDRQVSKDGFTAQWKVLDVNRTFPQSWVGDRYELFTLDDKCGIDFLQSADNYQKVNRSLKYCALFSIITFVVLFLVEILKKKLIHPIQYLLIGVALVIFYTLLLSISEYLSFNVSYLIAAVSIVLMLTLYARGVLQSWPLAFLVGGILAVLYGILFTIIQLQAYALLVGSIFIFCVLAIVMFISRKINWNNIRGDKEDSLDGNVQVKD